MDTMDTTTPTPAGPWITGIGNAPNVPPANMAATPEEPDMATSGLAGMSPTAPTLTGPSGEPAKPHESLARHVLDALSGVHAGDKMGWARATIAGGLAAAANVGKVPEGGGWLTGATRAAAGLQEQKQQEFERQEKLKADARAQQALENETADSQARRALLSAQTLAETQRRNFDAERQPHLLKSDDLNERKLGQEIQKNENDQNQVDVQTHAAFLASGGTEEQWNQATARTVPALAASNNHKDGLQGKNGMVVHNEELHAAGNDEAGVTHVTDAQRNKIVPNPEDPNWKGYIAGYSLDKNGDPQPVYVKPSTGVSLNDVIAFGAAAKEQRTKILDDQKQKLDLQAKRAQIEHEKAETGEVNERTKLVNLQAKQYLSDNTPNALGDTAAVNPATGNPMTPKEADAAWKTFNEKTLQPLQNNTDKSYRMASTAYNEYLAAKAQGKDLPTGAQSMLLLSQHLSTTFGNVKGSRVTKDMIAEHLGARGLTDSAVVAVQRIIDGDQLSPEQWKAFSDLIGQSRTFAYEGAIDNARSNGIGKSIPAWLPKAPAAGTKIDQSTASIYMYAAHGDAQRALTAAKAQGWGVQ